MKPVQYDKLYDELLEEYPVQEHPELYSLYTSMLNHLMKVFKLKHSTAVKLLLKVEEHLGIHLVRDRELTNMKMLKLKKDDDVKRYFRTLYYTHKLPLETISEIYDKYNDITSAIVKRYMHETGKITDNQIANYNYSRKYYSEHKQELLEKKRLYRQQKRLQKDK